MQLLLLLLSLTIPEKIDSATTLMETRHKNENNLIQSKNILKEVLEEEPDNEKALWKISRVYYFMGNMESDKEKKLEYYERGKNFAEKLIQINENNPEGHFYLAANLGRIGQVRGVMKSLSLAPKVKGSFEKTLQLDSLHTGAMDGLAVVYYSLPGIFGGDINKSIELLQKAISVDSNYTVLYLDLAKAYKKRNEPEKAKNILEKMLTIEKPTYPADFYLDDKEDAEKLLEELK